MNTTLTYTQTRLLELLAEDPGVTFRNLATKVNLPLSTAFDNVQVLRSLGLLDYGKCPTCGRGLIVLKGETA